MPGGKQDCSGGSLEENALAGMEGATKAIVDTAIPIVIVITAIALVKANTLWYIKSAPKTYYLSFEGKIIHKNYLLHMCIQ